MQVFWKPICKPPRLYLDGSISHIMIANLEDRFTHNYWSTYLHYLLTFSFGVCVEVVASKYNNIILEGVCMLAFATIFPNVQFITSEKSCCPPNCLCCMRDKSAH
ncbi:hypothetical protein ACJX0J_017379, partial [Zea mays]